MNSLVQRARETDISILREILKVLELNNETIKPVMEIIDKHMSKYCIHILKKHRGK